MVNIDCKANGSCPYEYFCDTQNQCEHNPVFPLGGYPIAIYLLFPFGSALCNASGNSFGQFKVLLLMVALDYSQSEATTMCYPLVLGTALYNFIRLVFSRHPQKDTSMVDYNIVSIIIPNVLYGSTIGSLIKDFVPPIVADSLIILLLVAFSFKFFFKLRGLINADKQGQDKKSQTLQLSSDQKSKENLLNDDKSLNQSLLKVNPSDSEKQSVKDDPSQVSQVKQINQQLQKQLQYEKGYHLKHILMVIGLFIVFQLVNFLAQGKIVYFSRCSPYYGIGIGCLTIFYGLIVAVVYFYTKKMMEYYQQIGFQYEYPLDKPKYFGMICLGAFWGGFNGGVFALGNSTTIIFTLLYLQIEPIVASATVGFQVTFSAAASLCEAIVQSQISWAVIGLFFGLTFIVGGILTFFFLKWINRFNRKTVNKILVGIVAGLTAMSAISMVLNIITSYISFGSHYMIAISGFC